MGLTEKEFSLRVKENSSRMALKRLNEETFDIGVSRRRSPPGRAVTWAGARPTSLLNAAEGSRSEAAVFVYADPIRKARRRVPATHLAAAEHGSLRLRKVSWLQPRSCTPTSDVTAA